MNFLDKLIHKDNHSILAVTNGKVLHIEKIPDHAFSNRLIGDGLAIEINSPHIYAPCTGTINSIASTQHAFTILLENGVEILVHIGLNTSKPNEHDFNYHVNVGDHITPDTHILTLSQQFLHSHQFKVITPIIILNSHEHPIKIMTTSSYTKKGKTLFTYK